MSHHRSSGPDAAPALARATGALDAFCAAERLPDALVWRLRVVLDEVISNIVRHGGAGARPRAIDVTFRRQADLVEMRVSDDGPAFDPLARPAPDVTLPLEARQPGGLGIALVRALTDDARYEWTGRNVLTVRARIDDAGTPGGSGPV